MRLVKLALAGRFVTAEQRQLGALEAHGRVVVRFRRCKKASTTIALGVQS
jgi:hypothetical protein